MRDIRQHGSTHGDASLNDLIRRAFEEIFFPLFEQHSEVTSF